MDFLTGAVLLPLIGAALHPLLGYCIQRGTSLGARLTVVVCIANLVTGLMFFVYLSPTGGWIPQGKDWWAVGNGLLFFFGQWLSARSLRDGDLAVHSSVLGFKVIIVGMFSVWVGLETGSLFLISGVVLAVIAVYLVSGGSLEGMKTHKATVAFTLLACLFFGFNDFLTGWQGREIGPARWMALMMGTSAVVSVGLLIKRRSQLGFVLRDWKIARWAIGAGLFLGIQALAVNVAFSVYGKPTLSNVVYSSRGVMAVAFLYLIGRTMDPRFVKKQTAGAILMMIALAVVLIG
ncbi:MAG: hypothetical protein ACON5N_17130 [Akkermansiaceae bacterium]